MVPPSPYLGMTPLVVANVPKQVDGDMFVEELLTINGKQLGLDILEGRAHIGTVERLTKRHFKTSDRIPSLSMKIWVSHHLAQRMLTLGSISTAFSMKPVKEFEKISLRCRRCLREDHLAQYCHNATVWKHCHHVGTHESRNCPKLKSTHKVLDIDMGGAKESATIAGKRKQPVEGITLLSRKKTRDAEPGSLVLDNIFTPLKSPMGKS